MTKMLRRLLRYYYLGGVASHFGDFQHNLLQSASLNQKDFSPQDPGINNLGCTPQS